MKYSILAFHIMPVFWEFEWTLDGENLCTSLFKTCEKIYGDRYLKNACESKKMAILQNTLSYSILLKPKHF